MIISRTPYRISFFGGGTDYPAWYGDHGGAVLATTINKYCYLHCRFLPPFFEHRTRVVWSMIETVKEHQDIEHPAVRAVINHLGIEEGLEIHHIGDLPARAGLGSSSAFAVGLLNALHGLQGRMASQLELAREAIYVEQELVADSVGVQDQIVTAVGGLNRVDIARDGSFTVSPLLISTQRIQELNDHLMLFFTGVSRNASTIAADQIQQIPHHQRELTQMLQLVDEAQSVVCGDTDITEFGRLLDES
jgi:D-glycero-alpha-D-manno-heptose-7-phosphate kinase